MVRIKDGDPDVLEKLLKFECDVCGCVFETEPKEVISSENIHNSHDGEITNGSFKFKRKTYFQTSCACPDCSYPCTNEILLKAEEF